MSLRPKEAEHLKEISQEAVLGFQQGDWEGPAALRLIWREIDSMVSVRRREAYAYLRALPPENSKCVSILACITAAVPGERTIRERTHAVYVTMEPRYLPKAVEKLTEDGYDVTNFGLGLERPLRNKG